MNSGYNKIVETVTGYNVYDKEHRDENGKLLYVEHIKQPLVQKKEVWVEYTVKELKQNELNELLEWFVYYDNQVSQYSRSLRLGIAFDKNISELDNQAMLNAARISTLRKELNEL